MSNLVKSEASAPILFNPLDSEHFLALERFCKKMSQSKMVPTAFRAGEKVTAEEAEANIMLAVQVGQEMHMTWLSVLQNMEVIQGKVGWKSTYLISKINTSGKFEPLDWEFGVDGKIGKLKYNETQYSKEKGKNVYVEKEFDGSNMDNVTCYAFTKRIGSDRVLKGPVVDLKMAVLEGWYTKAGSKWPTMREVMMSYRTAAFWSRLHFPEGTNGTLTAEEEQDISPSVQNVDYEIVPSVQEEIQQKANKTVMRMTPEPVKEEDKNAETVVETVDEETGEVTEVDTDEVGNGQDNSPVVDKTPPATGKRPRSF